MTISGAIIARVGVKEAQQSCPVCRADLNPTARFCGGCGYAVAPTATNYDSPESDTPSLVGQEVAGRYRIIGKLGEGGMGAVYRAEQISLKRQIALKVLKPELSSRPGLVRRFNAEAELAAKLNHPNTVTLYDFGQDKDGSLFIAMEFINGRSLREILVKEGPQPPERIVAVGVQICSSLADAHASGIVHRDLKPDNVMLSVRGKKTDIVSVLDFGIAKLRDEEGNITQQPMTRAGDMLGTPQYMAPEQIRGERVDARTDVYALGIILYEMATARLPFDAKSIMALLSMHLTESPIPPHQRRPDLRIDPNLERLVMQCLAKNPDERPPSMESVEDALTALTSRSGPISGASGAPYSQSPAASPGLGHLPTSHAATGHPQTGHPQRGAAASHAPHGTGHPQVATPHSGASGLADTGPPQQAFTPVRGGGQGHVAAASTPVGQQVRAPQQAPTRKSRAGLWAFLAVVVLGGGGAGAYLAFGPGAKTSEQDEQSKDLAGDSFMAQWTDEGASSDDHVDEELAELAEDIDDLDDIDSFLYARDVSYTDPKYGYVVDLPGTVTKLHAVDGEALFSGFVRGKRMTIYTAAWTDPREFTKKSATRELKRLAGIYDLRIVNSSGLIEGGYPVIRGRLKSTETKDEGDFILIRRSPLFYFAAIAASPSAYDEDRDFRSAFLEGHFYPDG